MGPAENIYLRHMTQFAALLRQEGLTVGAGETADACQLLAELDLSDRALVRDALRALLAKSREEQAAFDRSFDAFFVSLDQRQAARERQRREQVERRQQQLKARKRRGERHRKRTPPRQRRGQHENQLFHSSSFWEIAIAVPASP